jgi:hypothetical protein
VSKDPVATMGGFDRRRSDTNVAALASRVGALEGRMESVEYEQRAANRELAANTAVTRVTAGQVERITRVLNGEDDDEHDNGLRGKVDEMHEVFSDARRGFSLLNSVADGIAKVTKPVGYIAALGAAIMLYAKTGEFKWPPW